MSTGGGEIVLYTLTDALDILSQSGIVEAIGIVWFRHAGCIRSCRKAFDSVELLLDQAELYLFMS